MDTQNILALIVAYYLSRFDEQAYKNLRLGFKGDTHRAIGRALGVNPNTVKNMRDEFDPIHENPRVGWYQKELTPSRKRVVELFGDLDEQILRDVVHDILFEMDFREDSDLQDIADSISRAVETSRSIGFASSRARAQTGRKAEDYFMEYHDATRRPVDGLLRDRRHWACGYDFEIEGVNGSATFVEVKGLSADTGRVSFTDKEWRVAKDRLEAYVLALVKLEADPTITFVQNPAAKLQCQRRLYTAIQVTWDANVSDIASGSSIFASNDPRLRK